MMTVYAVDRMRFAIQPYLRARALLTHMQLQEQHCISAQRIRWRSCIRASLLQGQTRAERVSFPRHRYDACPLLSATGTPALLPRRSCAAGKGQQYARILHHKLQEQLPIKTASQAGARTCGSGSGSSAWSTGVARRRRSWPGQRRSRRRKAPTGCCSSPPPHHE